MLLKIIPLIVFGGPEIILLFIILPILFLFCRLILALIRWLNRR